MEYNEMVKYAWHVSINKQSIIQGVTLALILEQWDEKYPSDSLCEYSAYKPCRRSLTE